MNALSLNQEKAEGESKEPSRAERLIVRSQRRAKRAEDLLQSIGDLKAKSRHLTYFRIAFSLTVITFALLLSIMQVSDSDPSGFLASGLSVFIINLLALFVLGTRLNISKFFLDATNAILLAADIAALSYAVHVSQGLQSDLFFLYLLPILLASIVYERLGTFLTAFLASGAYAITVMTENMSFIPFLGGWQSPESGLTAAYAQGLWAQLGSRSAVLFFVSLIWAGFCHRMSMMVQENNMRLAEQLRANTDLVEELKVQARRENLSNSISLALRHTLDLNTILSTTCRQLSDALNAKHCLLISRSYTEETLLWDSAFLSGSSQESLLPAELRAYFLEHPWQRKPESEPFNKIIISESPFEGEDLKEIRNELIKLGLGGILIRPIMYGGHLVAVLSILSPEKARRWLPVELELIDSVAGQVALATEQALLVARLSESNDDLVRQNAILDAKNLELRQIQSQLIHQEKMASLGRIVAGIAHELNNPINFVHGNLPYLKEYFAEMKKLIALFGDLPPEHREAAEAALKRINYEFLLSDLDNIIADLQEGSERIRQIVRNLRSFSRLDEAELKEASVEESIESTLKILSQYFGRDKIPVKLNFCGLPPLLCYPGKLNQVWMNLLANAAEAMSGKEDAQVIVSTSCPDNDFVLVCIEDNGTGIEAGNQSKIFEPFFTSKPVGQGTGLGLSISHAIVERHGGEIWFESDGQKGTKFFVKLPRNLAAGQEPD